MGRARVYVYGGECSKGHRLEGHNALVRTRGNHTSISCRTCWNVYQAEYARKRRAAQRREREEIARNAEAISERMQRTEAERQEAVLGGSEGLA